MATKIEIEDAISAGIVAASGLDDQHVIWANYPVLANADATQPTLPYISLNIISGFNSRDYPSIEKPKVAERTASVTRRENEFLLNMQCFGEQSNDVTSKTLNWFDRPTVSRRICREQVTTINIDMVDADSEYFVVLGQGAVKVTSSATPTDLEIRDLFVTAIDLLPKISAVAGVLDSQFIVTGAPGLYVYVQLDGRMSTTLNVNSVDISMVENTGSTDISLVVNSLWEHRTSTDIRMLVADQDEDRAIGRIDTVEYSGDMSGLPISGVAP